MKSCPLVQPGPVAPVLCAVLLAGLLGGCTTSVTCYPSVQLLPVPTVLSADSVLRFGSSRLCQGLGSEWDSVPVMRPYLDPALIRGLPVDNYWAVREPVNTQQYNEATYTLLFVKSGRYTAYSVFPESAGWQGFSRAKAPKTELAWLMPSDCGRLPAKGRFHPRAGTTSYWMRLSSR